MRLWHEKLIPLLPRQQLLGQHRECCALRGNGWGKKHKTVDYIWNNYSEEYGRARLFTYHVIIMSEMRKRGYTFNSKWNDPDYRGRNCEKFDNSLIYYGWTKGLLCFNEHNEDYLKECLDNLKKKGIEIIEIKQ